jgi:hypothetical protein
MSITFSVAYDPADTGDLPDLNVSNTNGWTLLDALGIAPDYCGEVPATALVAMCDQLMAGHDDGVPSHEGPGMLGSAYVANMVDCGRRPGYLQDRAAALLAVAVAAQSLGRDVVWG